jgi:hypothetical protein
MDEAGGTMLQAACTPFAFDGAEDTALLAGDEDTKRIGGIVVATAKSLFVQGCPPIRSVAFLRKQSPAPLVGG